jgi:hypothetical protein
LRVVPTDLRTRHHHELFDGWGEAGKPLFAAYEAIGKNWDEAYNVGSSQLAIVKPPQQEVISYMPKSGLDRVITRQFPYSTLEPEDVLRLLKHVREEWIAKMSFTIRIIRDKDLLESRWVSFRTSAWDTIAKASSLAIWRSLDYSLFWFEDREDGKRVTEAESLLGRIGNLSREVPWDYYMEWADLLCKCKSELKPLG